MGEKRQRSRRHAALLQTNPACVYCGQPAATAEHMPPIGVFDFRWRPNEMVFAACELCNQQTRSVDNLAALISRIYPDHPEERGRQEVRKLMDGVANNIPGALPEMLVSPQDDVRFRQELGLSSGHFLRVDGPVISSHMSLFAAKMGFAMHRELSGKILPEDGIVLARWYSNVQSLRGEFPVESFDLFRDHRTLIQGSKHVGAQFWFKWVKTEDVTASISFFRQSFAVFAIGAATISGWDWPPELAWRRGDFHDLTSALVKAAANSN